VFVGAGAMGIRMEGASGLEGHIGIAGGNAVCDAFKCLPWPCSYVWQDRFIYGGGIRP